MRFTPGKAPPVRTVPYTDEELGRHDRRLGKYFVAGGLFLVLGSLHAVAEEPPVDGRVARPRRLRGPPRPRPLEHARDDRRRRHADGDRALLVRAAADRRPAARERGARAGGVLADRARARGLLRRAGRERDRDGAADRARAGRTWQAKQHMGQWYRAPVGMGAGVMGAGYWCFAANVFLTVFQSRLVRVPKPDWHLWKFLVCGRRRPHRRDGAGRDPGAAGERGLALHRRATRASGSTRSATRT